LDKIKNEISFIKIDGNRFNGYNDIPHECIIKGDTKCVSISAASILAKTYKDDYIRDLCLEHPDLDERYGWLNNKCYGTKIHQKGIQLYGITPYHRKSYKPCKLL
jgi:ribonuclease HII